MDCVDQESRFAQCPTMARMRLTQYRQRLTPQIHKAFWKYVSKSIWKWGIEAAGEILAACVALLLVTPFLAFFFPYCLPWLGAHWRFMPSVFQTLKPGESRQPVEKRQELKRFPHRGYGQASM